MKRTVRRVIETALPILGISIILGSVLLNPDSMQLHVSVLLVGVLILITTGPPWRLARRFLPNERVSWALREEADRFLGLMRVLKQTADKGDDGQEHDELAEDTVEQMRASVDRIVELIG